MHAQLVSRFGRFGVSSLILCLSASAWAQEAVPHTRPTTTSAPVIVTGSELPSAYGAPPDFSRTRVSPSVTAYVLPPGGFLAASIYEGEYNRHEHPGHLFTQEFEYGLPHRFGIAAEVSAEVFRGRSQIRNISLEARYALADWNKIPLNPTLFAEYKFGTGHILREEGMEEEEEEGDEDMPSGEALRRKMTSKIRHAQEADEEEEEEEFGDRGPRQPDAVEFRLLLAQDFAEHVEWALNGFVEQEISGDRGREWGFAQSIDFPLTHNESVKLGVELEYKNFTDKDTRDEPAHSLVIGPNFIWKPNRWARVDVAPLFGVTEDSPDMQLFVVFSMAFGGKHGGEAESPVSTRNR